MTTSDICRRLWISNAGFFKLKAKLGGMDVSDARKLKALGDENATLKKLLPISVLRASSVSKIRDIRGLKNQQLDRYNVVWT